MWIVKNHHEVGTEGDISCSDMVTNKVKMVHLSIKANLHVKKDVGPLSHDELVCLLDAWVVVRLEFWHHEGVLFHEVICVLYNFVYLI